ncbi:MAG: prolipoprotein diacylglyceryl transferase [Chloroflexota bacterium]|nr:prolipoprotein diacylglyceryl transferase [Chloroflexota bacterium]MDE3193140.1 prolipoprotein diacylglyceryl transferase [Chloroflexota bacterium]
MTIDVDPVIFHLGPFAPGWYGVFVALGMAAGLTLALREARRKGLPVAEVGSIAFWVVAGALVGARALHVIDRWDLYADDPPRALAVWNGGLAILGAVLGGTLTGVALALRRRLPLLTISDAAAPGVILGQAIGRLACLFTGDAVGRATQGFGVTYLHAGAMVPQLGVAYEPVFLYEMAWDLLVLAALWWLRPRLRIDGTLFAAYLALYALGKFALTFRRVEVVWLAGLQEAQLLSLAALGLAAAWAWWARRQRRLAEAAIAAASASV